MLASLPHCYIYDEDEYIGKMDALDIHSGYMAEIIIDARNPRDTIHYDTSYPCALCGKTVHTVDVCELQKNMTY